VARDLSERVRGHGWLWGILRQDFAYTNEAYDRLRGNLRSSGNSRGRGGLCPNFLR
jgi:hypothetical protein